jgi:hypothetical protein
MPKRTSRLFYHEPDTEVGFAGMLKELRVGATPVARRTCLELNATRGDV